jgi:hypothetical protein|nr:MAG TPA: Selenium binding protein, Selenium-Binding Protein [Caudoviricetes sp.]
MKKLVFLILVVGLFAACVTPKLPEPYGFSSLLDYSPLTDKGIFVTESNSVSFDYEALGSVSATEVGGWVKKGKEPKATRESNKSRNDDMYVDIDRNQYTGKYVYVAPSLDMAMERMVNTLKVVGANGIINLKVQVESDRIIISGMAIKK